MNWNDASYIFLVLSNRWVNSENLEYVNVGAVQCLAVQLLNKSCHFARQKNASARGVSGLFLIQSRQLAGLLAVSHQPMNV